LGAVPRAKPARHCRVAEVSLHSHLRSRASPREDAPAQDQQSKVADGKGPSRIETISRLDGPDHPRSRRCPVCGWSRPSQIETMSRLWMVQTIPDRDDVPFVDGPDHPRSRRCPVCGWSRPSQIETMSRLWMVRTIPTGTISCFGWGLTHPNRPDLPFCDDLDPSRFFHALLADAGGDSA
jgi:rubredoxin